MGGSVASDCAVPGLAEALAARGIALAERAPVVLTADPVRLGGAAQVVLLVDHAADVSRALDAGAADAVLADAPAEEIAARLAARLRDAAPPLGIGELIIDRIARRVTRGGRTLALLPREYALLLHLAQHAGAVVPRAALLEAVWGLRFDPGTNVVAVHVSRLRAKLDDGFAAPMLRTAKGVGYWLAAA